jgi:hypothetical protein
MRQELRMKKIVLWFLASVAAASAGTVNLSQGGWDTGGPLDITFTGIDSDANGTYELDELTSFNASFSLGTGQSTTWSLSDIESDGFAYTSASDYFLRADNGSYFLYENGFREGSIGFVTDPYNTYLAATGDFMTEAPEPASTCLVGAAAAGLMVARSVRRRRSAAGN